MKSCGFLIYEQTPPTNQLCAFGQGVNSLI
mgnify:CR=1 FL=1